MTGYGHCGDLRHALAVYVLGAIEPADRAAVVRHLAACPRCTAEVAGLAGLPGLLRRISPAEADPAAEPDPPADADPAGGSGPAR